jgi:hypothetical protein
MNGTAVASGHAKVVRDADLNVNRRPLLRFVERLARRAQTDAAALIARALLRRELDAPFERQAPHFPLRVRRPELLPVASDSGQGGCARWSASPATALADGKITTATFASAATVRKVSAMLGNEMVRCGMPTPTTPKTATAFIGKRNARGS